MARFDRLREQLGRQKWSWHLACQRPLDIQRHAAAELLIVDGKRMSTSVERDPTALRPHALAQIACHEKLSIDAQLDLVVAPGEKFDRLRLTYVEKSAPPRAEVLTRQVWTGVEKGEIDLRRWRLDRGARERRLRVEGPNQSGS